MKSINSVFLQQRLSVNGKMLLWFPLYPVSMVWVHRKNSLNMMISLRPGMEKDRDEVIKELIDIQYNRNEMDFHRGTFRVRGDVLEIFPANYSDRAIRVEFFGDEIDRITEVDVLTGEIHNELKHAAIFPASHYVVPQSQIQKAADAILEENERTGFLF